MPENSLATKQETALTETAERPTAEEISVLNAAEKIGFNLTHKMNQGALKRLMTFCQRYIGSLWIIISTYNLLRVHGIENFERHGSLPSQG